MDSKNFVIDRHCEDTFNYFGLIKVIQLCHEMSFLSCHVKSILQNQLSSATENEFWIEKLEQSQTYKVIGKFGDMKVLPNQRVCKENVKNLSVLLEVELYKKTKNTDPIVLPNYMFQDHLYVFSIYSLKSIICDVKTLIKKKPLSIYQISFLIFNMLKGIEFLHNNKIIHRNITAENIFVFENQIKIGNFSCAVLEKASFCFELATKIFPFCSPDYFKPNSRVTLKTDIWAIGVFACELWTKTAGTPFLREGIPGCLATAEMMLKLNFDSNVVVINDTQGVVLTLDQFHFLECCLQQNYNLRKCVFDLLTHSVLKEKNVLFE